MIKFTYIFGWVSNFIKSKTQTKQHNIQLQALTEGYTNQQDRKQYLQREQNKHYISKFACKFHK